MTVIDVILDRPRVVPKQKINRNRKRKLFEDRSYMPGIQGCFIGGNILPKNPNKLISMDGNGGSNPELDADAKTIKKGKNEGNSFTSSPPLRKQKILVKTRTLIRNRRKSRWKLKFHHQALPPEYLKHYKQQERKMRQTETGNPNRKLLKKNSRRLFGDGHEKPKVENSDVIVVKMEEDFDSENKVLDGDEPVASEKSEKVSPQKTIICGSKDFKEMERRSPYVMPANATSPSSPSPTYHEVGDNFIQSSSGLPGIPHLQIDVSQNKAFLENLLTNQIEINRVVRKEKKSTGPKSSQSPLSKVKIVQQPENQKKSYPIPTTGKIINYSDLPYMGEITLDGIKPRRGRKPKKADICHLIYKNYGHVFPGAPSKESDEDLAAKNPTRWRPEIKKSAIHSSQRTKGLSENVTALTAANRPDSPLPSVSGLINHSEVQNRIINSLLEKRLTQEMKLMTRLSKDGEKSIAEEIGEEPLNLCIRDLESLKIEFLQAKQKDLKEEMSERSNNIEITGVGKSDSDVESTDDNDDEDDLAPFNLVTTELRDSSDEDTLLSLGDQVTLTKVKSPLKKEESKTSRSRPSGITSPMLFWPGGGLLLPGISPISRYANLTDPLTSSDPESKIHNFPSENVGKSHLKRIASNSNVSKPLHAITKRKRSAIFIPPVPVESSANPTTEVSICKFKFTGGAKPSLQKKKMLSVDSGGNFRYYSGTGDKSMRGYEYFPRESLQQCQENTGCSPSGVFLTASALGSGEKIPEEIGHSGFFDSDFPLQASVPKTNEDLYKSRLKQNEKKPDEEKIRSDIAFCKTFREHLLRSGPENADLGTVLEESDKDDGNFSDQSERDFDPRTLPQSYFHALKAHVEENRKSGKLGGGISRTRQLRKTRKSIAREKLEQTFKEKGFLIQTQQLESAEGATYCKFRQLRKFTRYLFRSWKDYLPGNVRNLSVDAGVENPESLMQIPEVNMKAEATNTRESNRSND